MSIKLNDKNYQERIEEGLDDTFMRQAVYGAQERLKHNRIASEEGVGNWEEWRDAGEEIRQHTLENLDYYLEQLSDNVAKRGGKVLFAQTPEEANEYVEKVVLQKQAKKIVKSKSMVTEEIGLNDVIQKHGIDVVETDLGEWILQLDEDPPSHIVAPALHKDRKRIQEVFQEKRSYSGTEEPEELAQFAREQLREDFLSADIGITGCNFAVADSGAITLVTNEGNARLATALPDTHIAVMGMERVVPSWEELDVLVSLLTRAAVGQKLTSYITSLITNRLDQELDGPSDFHLVIVDNGRSKILGTEFQSALQCIRCAACINVCPVYRHVGGHAYGSIYPGPIGAVLTPLLDGYEDHQDLPYASTLCAACTEACPVKIPLHELLVRHREVIVEKQNQSPISEKAMMAGFGQWAQHPSIYNMSTKLANTLLKPWSKDDTITNGPGPLKGWTDTRNFPAPTKQSFRSWYKACKEEA